MSSHVYISVDVVPVIESAPSARLPTFTSITTPPTSHRHHDHHHHHHSKHREGRQGTGSKRLGLTNVEDTGHQRQHRESKGILKHARSHDNLHSNNNNNTTDSAGFGSNTESLENLLDAGNQNQLNHHNTHTMGEKSNSGSKVAELISSYEETAKLSQSSSDSGRSFKMERERGEGESGERARVGRVMSIVTEHAYSKPQTLVLREVNTHTFNRTNPSMHVHVYT